MTGGGRRRLWATLLTLPALSLMIGLGSWQLERLAWKTGLIAARQAALAAAPVELNQAADLGGLEFRRVTGTGRFLVKPPLYLYPRSSKGQAGVHVLTPFALAGGGIIIVNRGFVPSPGTAPRNWTDPITDAPFQLQGILRARLARPTGAIEGIDRQRIIGWYDLETIAAHYQLALLPAVIEAANSPDPTQPPRPGQSRRDLPNNHLQYAITWFALALVLLVIFAIFWCQQGARDNSRL